MKMQNFARHPITVEFMFLEPHSQQCSMAINEQFTQLIFQATIRISEESLVTVIIRKMLLQPKGLKPGVGGWGAGGWFVWFVLVFLIEEEKKTKIEGRLKKSSKIQFMFRLRMQNDLALTEELYLSCRFLINQYKFLYHVS